MDAIENHKPEAVLNERHLSQYQRDSSVLNDDLVYLHSNLQLITQLGEFDAELFEAPTALFWYLGNLLITDCGMVCARIWKDKARGTLTLNRFAEWVLDPAIRPQYREALKLRLKKAALSPEAEEIVESLRDIRHARLGHIDHSVIAGLKTEPKSVPLESIKTLAQSFASFFNALTFGTVHEFVLVQFYAASGDWHKADLGYVLDRIALGSKWFGDVDQYPGLWRIMRDRVNPEQLNRINAIRTRHGMPLLEK